MNIAVIFLAFTAGAATGGLIYNLWQGKELRHLKAESDHLWDMLLGKAGRSGKP